MKNAPIKNVSMKTASTASTTSTPVYASTKKSARATRSASKESSAYGYKHDFDYYNDNYNSSYTDDNDDYSDDDDYSLRLSDSGQTLKHLKDKWEFYYDVPFLGKVTTTVFAKTFEEGLVLARNQDKRFYAGRIIEAY